MLEKIAGILGFLSMFGMVFLTILLSFLEMEYEAGVVFISSLFLFFVSMGIYLIKLGRE